jgi:hypothetical protein
LFTRRVRAPHPVIVDPLRSLSEAFNVSDLVEQLRDQVAYQSTLLLIEVYELCELAERRTGSDPSVRSAPSTASPASSLSTGRLGTSGPHVSNVELAARAARRSPRPQKVDVGQPSSASDGPSQADGRG